MDDSKGGRRIITGRSSTGDVQEAFNDAVRQLGHGVAWRLESIDGRTGGSKGNQLNVNIHPEPSAADGGA